MFVLYLVELFSTDSPELCDNVSNNEDGLAGGAVFVFSGCPSVYPILVNVISQDLCKNL